MLKVIFAALGVVVPLTASFAAELPLDGRTVIRETERVRVVREGVGPCWRRRLAFYEITNPDWIVPICVYPGAALPRTTSSGYVLQ